MAACDTASVPAARVLLAGPDTIHLSLDLEISDELRGKLDSEKAMAQEADKFNVIHCPEWLGAQVLRMVHAVGMVSCWKPYLSSLRENNRSSVSRMNAGFSSSHTPVPLVRLTSLVCCHWCPGPAYPAVSAPVR
jgi:hypothetical protein